MERAAFVLVRVCVIMVTLDVAHPVRVIFSALVLPTRLDRRLVDGTAWACPTPVFRAGHAAGRALICKPPTYVVRRSMRCLADATGKDGDADNGEEEKGDGRDDAGDNVNSEGSEKSDKSGTDWDSSWNEFNKTREGGVFNLPDETGVPADVRDERVERLTNAWSNENGFLVGIAVIALIALFYVYVFATGGISSQ